MYLKKKSIAFLALLTLLLIIGWWTLHEPLSFLLLFAAVGLFMVIQFETYTRLQHQLHSTYRQVESLFSLYSTLKTRHPLPPMREWAISPDFANLVISLIWERKPQLVVELGSGLSTLISAYCLQELASGKLVSLDHDQQFAAQSARSITQHGLQDIATVIHAPLKACAIRNTTWLWYDLAQTQLPQPIDMLIVDGPPGDIQKLARYPALPILSHLLSDDAILLLDDAFRPDERKIVKLWLKEFGSFSIEEIPTEKGAVILRRQNT